MPITMAHTRPTDPATATARVTRDMVLATGTATPAMATQAMATQAMATQAPSQWRLAIGHITRAVLVITSAVPIMFGGRDIGYGGMVVRFGFTVSTC